LTANRPSRGGTLDVTRECKSSEGSFDANTAGTPPYSRQSLQDICDGKLPITSAAPFDVEKVEIPICGKLWWEDGTQYECLMDKGVHTKHGLRGMVRKVED
jgi:hypothetical protein